MAVFDFLKEQIKEPERNKHLEQIDVDRIIPNPNQPRQAFDDESIQELAQSIRQVGLIQPLVVRRMDGGYELVAGERRLRACKSIGMKKVYCIVQNDIFEEDSAMMALIENLQRENLHFLEEAQCYQTMLSTYNLKQEELAERLGKSQSSIANKLRVLKFSPAVKTAMIEAHLTERHARTLLRIRDESVQLELIGKVHERGLSVKDTEKLVDKTLNRLFDQKESGARPRPVIILYG